MADPILIGGDWRQGGGAPLPSINPADRSVTAEVSSASPADVEEAVAAGRRAMDDPAWRDLKPHERAQHLLRVSAIISSRAEELAQLQMRDNGKPITETRALVASAAGTFKYYAAACETLEGEITPSRGPYVSMSVYEPIGVVGAITPWNSPIASEAQKLAPALAAGNAVIVKPAEATPLLALELGRICLEAGIPKGLVSVLPGPGSEVGAAIVAHRDVRFVTFTGGTVTGRAIAHMAADKLMPVSLELGGKSPNVVFADAKLDHAVNGVLFGVFSSQGQSCIAGSRLFVEERIHNAFVERLVERTEKLRVGPPAELETQMGPQISDEHRAKIESYVALGREEGGTVLSGGERPRGEIYDRGSYFRPTILTGLDNSARVCREEIFGPVLVVLPFRDEDDLVAQANDSVYGLACGIWTEDYRRAFRVARRIEAGTVWINTYKLFSISTPFGGTKESGYGREKGRHGILRYMQQKSLYWGMNEAPLPWAD